MGIRETLNENPGITTAATAIIILGALAFIVVSMLRGGGAEGPPTKAYFSDDDGKSFFVDSVTQIPPFQRDGKTAYRAHVFTCDGGKTKFVGYLERYTPEAKKRAEESARRNPNSVSFERDEVTGVEVKKPGTGDTGWVKQTHPKFMDVIDVRCPDGTTNGLEPVHSP